MMKNNKNIEFEIVLALLKSFQKDNLLTSNEVQSIVLKYKNKYQATREIA